jgi:hypothetical protein
MAGQRGASHISSLYRAFCVWAFGTSCAGAIANNERMRLPMIDRQSCFSFFIAALFLATAWPSLARADTASARAPLDSAQLEAFAALVGESTSTVAQRMATDPSLVPLAAKAADARRQRKHSGKVLTITGFSIFGLGTAIGFEMIVASLGSYNCPSNGCPEGGNHGLPGLVVALVSEAIGLAMAIPGIVKMARQSEAETEASARYRPVAAPHDGSASSSSLSSPTQSLRTELPETSMHPTGFLLPLLSGTF